VVGQDLDYLMSVIFSALKISSVVGVLLDGGVMPRALAWGATFEALAPMRLSYSLIKGNNSNVFIFGFIFYIT